MTQRKASEIEDDLSSLIVYAKEAKHFTINEDWENALDQLELVIDYLYSARKSLKRHLG